jgi:N-acetylglucosamine-6-phosphate deacetylase
MGFLAPCFIDIQIYGAYFLYWLLTHPLLLSKDYEYCKAGGAPFFQPTVATNSTMFFINL